jgi:hypothetical protein
MRKADFLSTVFVGTYLLVCEDNSIWLQRAHVTFVECSVVVVTDSVDNILVNVLVNKSYIIHKWYII